MKDIVQNILENSNSVSGVILKKSPNGYELQLNQPSGKGWMLFHTLFPGLTLAQIHVNALKWPESDANTELKPLLINYCVSGRSELLLDDGAYIYMKENDFSVSGQTAQKEYIFPTGEYQGLKIYLFCNPVTRLQITFLLIFPIWKKSFVTREKPISTKLIISCQKPFGSFGKPLRKILYFIYEFIHSNFFIYC